MTKENFQGVEWVETIYFEDPKAEIPIPKLGMIAVVEEKTAELLMKTDLAVLHVKEHLKVGGWVALVLPMDALTLKEFAATPPSQDKKPSTAEKKAHRLQKTVSGIFSSTKKETSTQRGSLSGVDMERRFSEGGLTARPQTIAPYKTTGTKWGAKVNETNTGFDWVIPPRTIGNHVSDKVIKKEGGNCTAKGGVRKVFLWLESIVLPGTKLTLEMGKDPQQPTSIGIHGVPDNVVSLWFARVQTALQYHLPILEIPEEPNREVAILLSERMNIPDDKVSFWAEEEVRPKAPIVRGFKARSERFDLESLKEYQQKIRSSKIQPQEFANTKQPVEVGQGNEDDGYCRIGELKATTKAMQQINVLTSNLENASFERRSSEPHTLPSHRETVTGPRAQLSVQRSNNNNNSVEHEASDVEDDTYQNVGRTSKDAQKSPSNGKYVKQLESDYGVSPRLGGTSSPK